MVVKSALVALAPAALLLACGPATGSAMGSATDPPSKVSVARPPQTSTTSVDPATDSVGEVRTCTADDVVAQLRPEGEGAGGHLLALVDFRNISSTTCLLTGYPKRVTLTEKGQPLVTATAGSFFPVPASAPMKSGATTTLGMETDSTCAARPDGGPSGPLYHGLRFELEGGAISVAVLNGLDVGCGVYLATFTNWQ